MATQNSQGDRVKRCLELQDALQQLPPEIQHKMLPACRTIVLRRTSKTMQMAVEKADAVVQVRDGNPFFNAQGLVEKLNGLSMWCKVTVLRAVSLPAPALRLRGCHSIEDALQPGMQTRSLL